MALLKSGETSRALLAIDIMQLEMAEDAASLSQLGKVEFARQKFTKLSVESNNFKVIQLSFEFFYRTGDLKAAHATLERCLELAGRNEVSSAAAFAYEGLGVVYKIRGDFKQAETMYKNR